MTTLTPTSSTSTAPTQGNQQHDQGGGPDPHRLRARGVLRAEWIKLRSVRSTWTTLAAAGAAMLIVGGIFSGFIGGEFSGGQADDLARDPTSAALSGTLLAQLIIGVLGVLVITTEYATGLLRTTLTVVPTRLPVLAAKAAVLTVVTFAVMLAASLAAFLTGQALIGHGGHHTASLSDPNVLRAVIGTAGYLSAIALLGLALGTLLRSTAAAISTLLAAVFLLPGLGTLLLPASWQGDVLPYLPSNAGRAITSVTSTPDLLSPGAGLSVLLAWLLLPLAAAAITLHRRSA